MPVQKPAVRTKARARLITYKPASILSITLARIPLYILLPIFSFVPMDERSLVAFGYAMITHIGIEFR